MAHGPRVPMAHRALVVLHHRGAEVPRVPPEDVQVDGGPEGHGKLQVGQQGPTHLERFWGVRMDGEDGPQKKRTKTEVKIMRY